MKLFRKKKLTELELELKKYPRRDRKKFEELYYQYQNNKVLKTIKD